MANGITGQRGGSQFFGGRTVGGQRFLTNIPERALELGDPSVVGPPQIEALPAPRGIIPIEQRVQKPVAAMSLGEKQGLRQRIETKGREIGASVDQVNTELQKRGLFGAQFAPGATEEVSEVQSSKILPGGFTQIVRKDGTTELVTVKEANRKIIEDLDKKDAALQGLRAGERGAAKLAINKSKEAFEKMTLTQENIASMGDAIAEIDAGAKTGVIQSRLPSFRASSIRLENIQKRLGLNVIGGVTFGALSKGELDLALSVALPDTQDETELRKWLVDKKAAQEKLVDNLQEAAIFLGTPGNTVPKFLQSQRGQGGAAEQTPPPTTTTAPSTQEGATATNPTTGAKLIFRGGQWQTI